MTPRALSFGAVASDYERFRPGYPDALVDAVLAYAARPIRTALEIGAGTGKATRLFAARAIAVTATEPDPAMLRELRSHVPANVTTVQASLEELSVAASYDLVFAAAALHWTSPDHRWARIAALLEPDGIFGSLGGPMRLADAELQAVVKQASAPFLEDDEIPSPDATPAHSPMQWPGTELRRSGRFTDIRQLIIERRIAMSADDYVGHLSTISAYLELAEADRREVLRRIRRVLPEQVALVADLTLHLGRRA